MGWTSRQRWWLLAGAWLILVVLGVWGFVIQSDELGLDRGFTDHLYFTIQLAALDFQGESEAINWQLQIARFAAPVLAAGTLAQSASVVFKEQFARWKAQLARDHTVVCGLDGVGGRLVEALVADGRRVVAIDADPTAPGVAAANGLGVPVVLGDPTDAAVLGAARADRASRVVATTPSDGTNVAIAAALRSLGARHGRPPLRCSVRVTDGDLAHLLRSQELGGDDPIRVEFFNVHERAAQSLVAQHPVAGDHESTAHLLILGLGQFGGAVLVSAAQRWADRAAGPLAVTVVDRSATGRLHGLCLQHPALGPSISAATIDLDTRTPDATAVDHLDERIRAAPPTLVVVAFEDESMAWSSGLFIRRHLTAPVDVVVRTNSDGGFGQQLQAAIRDDGAGRTLTFPVYANACSVALVEGGVREQLARSVHDDYLARAGSGGYQRPWDDLTEAEQESSRSAADAIVGRLDGLGMELAPLRQWGAVGVDLTADEIECIAADEHARWKRERELAGWTWGAARNDATQRNPLLVEWAALGDDAKADNRRTASKLPAMLARAGFEIVRR